MNFKGTLLSVLLIGSSATVALGQDSMLDSLRNALGNHKGEDSTKVRLLINLSNTIVWNDTEEALDLAKEALTLAKQISWVKGEAFAYRQIGLVYYRMADFISAMEMSQEALKVNEELDDKGFEISVYNNLGNIHSDMKEYDKAQAAYGRFLTLSQDLGQKDYEVIGLVNRGLVFREQKKFGKAIEDLQQALTLARGEGFVYFEAVILNNLGLTFRDSGNISEAINYFRQSADKAGTSNAMTRSSSLNGLAGIFLKQNKLDSAKLLAREALDLAKDTGSLEQERDAWETLSILYDSTNNTSEALNAFRKFVSLRDSILSEESKSELTRKEMQFQMDLEQAVSTAEIQRQTLFRNIALGGSLILIVSALLGYHLYKRKRDALEAQKEAEFLRNVAETELKLLRSQMNPHFIFNSLNSISDYIDKNNPQTAINYLTKFSKLMRMTLENSEKENVTVQEDIEWMELYLQLEATRLKDKLSYSISIDDNLEP
ncbi:MAG: tetratricopeptide repeat protein, partial [Bacteroidota bacterium]